MAIDHDNVHESTPRNRQTAGERPAGPEPTGMAEAHRVSLADRLASASWQAMLAFTVGLGAVVGALGGRRVGSFEAVVGRGLFGAAAMAVLIIPLLLWSRAPLRRLSPSDRRAIVDAVRFGRPVGDPRLVGPLLVYTASARKWVSPASTKVNAAAVGVMAALSVVAATRYGRVGDVSSTIFCACYAVGSGWAMTILPAVGRASRRNLDAAEEAARALHEETHPAAGGLRAGHQGTLRTAP